MRKGTGSAYDKWNISVVICDTDIPKRFILVCPPKVKVSNFSFDGIPI
jgi:hypothetical protein